MMFMNEWEIDRAVQTTSASTIRGRMARFLREFKEEVNAHSDGWPYWRLPAQSAKRLMEALQQSYQEPTPEQFKKALAPIKRFYTQHGYKAGMKMPDESGTGLGALFGRR